jgi:pilus assembly protein CpaE
MSTGDRLYNTLLPQASVALYSTDADNVKIAAELSDDWRFARVKMATHDGGVTDAIMDCQNGSAPNLIIIQSNDVDDAFASKLEELAQSCPEGTGAIIIGPDNDINLYRHLVDMGVSDYLVHPLTRPVLAGVIAKALIQELGVKDSHLTAFIGAKGGVGTTALSAAMAWGISEFLNQKTVLLDGSGGWSPYNVSMGIEPGGTLLDAAEAAVQGDEESLSRMLHGASDTLDVLASGGNNPFDRPVTPAQLEGLHDMLMARYPHVVTDLSDASSGIKKVVLNKANMIVVASIPTIPALRQARSLITEIVNIRGGDTDNIKLLINMQGMSSGHEMSVKDIKEAVGTDVSACIPFAPKIFIGTESEGRRVIDDPQGAEFVRDELLPLIGGHYEGVVKAGFLSGILHSLKGQTKNSEAHHVR